MTLIACLHPNGCRTLIADVLVTSPDLPDGDLVLPTRRYIAPDQLRQMQRKPTALRRKVIEIRPDLIALWAGNYDDACNFARWARDWFRNAPAVEQDLIDFLECYYHEPIADFHAIVTSTIFNRCYHIGLVRSSNSPFASEYAVAGTGAEMFMNMVDHMAPHQDANIAPDMDGLQISNDFMAREIMTGETVQAEFGGGYEVLYCGQDGFERVDDVIHVFRGAKMSGNEVEISDHPHVTRQWYESNNLYIASLSMPSAQEQGLEYAAFCVPDILGEQTKYLRTINSIADRPNYLCIHHLVEIEDTRTPATLVMRGDAIDQYFKLSRDDSGVTFESTPEYEHLLREQAAQLKDLLRHR